MQHATHGGDGRASDGPRLSPPAGAPVGALCPEATALFHAARRGSFELGAAHLPAGHFAKPAIQLPWGGAGEQGGPAHWRGGLYPPVRLQPERACAFQGCVVVGMPGPLDFPEAGIRGRQHNAADLTHESTAWLSAMGLELT